MTPRLEFDLHGSWQARVLKGTSGKMAAVVMSVLAHNFDDQMLPLLRLVFPGFSGVAAPFLCSAAKISRAGRVYAQRVTRDGESIENYVVFQNEAQLQFAFRKLADELKLSDADRLDLFAAVKKWIVCDYRIDPNTGEKERAA